MGPGAIVGLSAFIDEQVRKRRIIHFTGPRDANVARYLTRIGLAKLLEEFDISHSLPNINMNAAIDEKTIVGLRRFSETDDVAGVLAILNYQAVPQESQRVVSRALGEAGCNVPDHAQVSHGYIAAQVAQNGSALGFAVGDSGVGVYRPFMTQGATSERHALKLALTGHSRTGDPDRGTGLKGIVEALSKPRSSGMLLSGSSSFSIRSDGLHPWKHQTNFHGTIIEGSLPIDS